MADSKARFEAGSSDGSEPEDLQVPPGAVRVGEDLYMVPLGRDADGFQQFTPFSRSRMVVTAIHYRDGKGGFTLRKEEAVRG